ncbi:hypothetical protein V6N11_020212 [Hibiscus sabdariffa]|uniref:Uncharacterized protein n=1 Tax=Hibiscus sabdariffa TaxID=183260 RepID=A0ABR2Q7R7_9ROSI
MANFSPRISEVDSGFPRVSPLRDPFPPLVGTANGRPPDGLLQCALPPRLEQLADPVNVEDQQAGKRSRGENVVVMDVSLEDVDRSETTGKRPGDSEGMVCDVSGTMLSEGNSLVKPSYRDLLVGNKSPNPPASAIPELDVEIHEEDVHISFVDGTPLIDFSARVHEKGTTGRFTTMAGSGMFDILSTLEQEDELQEVQPPQQFVSEYAPHLESGVEQDGTLAGADRLEVPGEVRDGGKRVAIGSEPLSFVSKEVVESLTGNLEVVSTDVVVPTKVSLNTKSHVAIRVLERGVTLNSKTVPNRRSDAGGHLLAPRTSNQAPVGKKVDRKGSSNRKKTDSRSSSKVALGEWLGNMERDLERSQAQNAVSGAPQDGPSTIVDSEVVWRENTSFAQ